jgi:hypothetical protein
MDAAEFRRSLAALIGSEQYFRILRYLNDEGRWRGRFLFWQEELLRPLASHSVVRPVSFHRFEALLRVCELHQAELERDSEGVSSWCHGAVTDYTRAKAERFPNTDCGPLVMGNRLDNFRTGLWYCPACRVAEEEWKAARGW